MEESLMGRRKPGKPRRTRVPRQYTLRDLDPPGCGYDVWLQADEEIDPASLNNTCLEAGPLDLLRRVHTLAGVYHGQVPQAAVLLDYLLDGGSLPIARGEDVDLVPVETMAQAQGELSTTTVRESIHGLHAAGAFVLFVHEKEGREAHFVRMGCPPRHPGDPWTFVGEEDEVAAATCIPDAIWQELPLDVAATVAYMRACRSQLEDPDPEQYGTHEGVNGTKHAKELFAAALSSGFVDRKGCEACPSGHLCTSSD
ncbi:hypothetical protein [Streptomyces sp. NPDC058254]|uniref:hypothetical protein n=1 Tax=Streptomyces sp. NPDC058254 TaxID=3346406 RepID=UPI0036E549E2